MSNDERAAQQPAPQGALRLLVGSTSGRKIQVVRQVFAAYWGRREVITSGCDVPSQVSEMPQDQETLRGARHRAQGCRRAALHGIDFYIGA